MKVNYENTGFRKKSKTISKYDTNAHKICSKYFNSVDIIFINTGKHFKDDIDNRDRYHIIISSDHETMEFKYGNCMNDTNKGVVPSIYDIICCITKDDPGQIYEFFNEFGYDGSKKSSHDIYNDVVKEYNDFRQLFKNEIIPDEFYEIF